MNCHVSGRAHIETVGILRDSAIVLNSRELKASVDHISGEAGDIVEDVGCILEPEVADDDTRRLFDLHHGRSSVGRVRGEFCLVRHIHQDVKDANNRLRTK